VDLGTDRVRCPYEGGYATMPSTTSTIWLELRNTTTAKQWITLTLNKTSPNPSQELGLTGSTNYRIGPQLPLRKKAFHLLPNFYSSMVWVWCGHQWWIYGGKG